LSVRAFSAFSFGFFTWYCAIARIRMPGLDRAPCSGIVVAAFNDPMSLSQHAFDAIDFVSNNDHRLKQREYLSSPFAFGGASHLNAPGLTGASG
jgi:hypothetical protein